MINVEQLIEKAKNLLLENKFEHAEIIFKKILEIDPTNYKVQNNIGVILTKLNKLNDAEENFKKVIKLNSTFEIAYYNLGTIQEKLCKIDEAKDSFKKAIELNPQYVDAYINLGNLLLKINDFYNAEKCFENATQYKPNLPIAYFNLGLSQSKQSKYELAEKNYKKVLEISPDFDDARHNLKKIYREKKLINTINQNIKKNKNHNLKNTIDLSKKPFITKKEIESGLISELYKIKTEELGKSRNFRYGNGVCSNFELFENNSEIIKNVEKNIIKITTQIFNSNIFIIESFFNILREDSGLTSHHHLNDFDKKYNLSSRKYSLTYYLSVGDQNSKDPGILKLYDPNIEILPSPGTVIIFQANRLHSVAYNGKADRVMIGVNFYSI